MIKMNELNVYFCLNVVFFHRLWYNHGSLIKFGSDFMRLFINFVKRKSENFIRKLKGGKLSLDELSLFLIIAAVVMILLILLLRLHRFALIAWIPLLISYWRTFSKNRMQRAKENQVFIKHYYPMSSYVKNTYRRLLSKKDHHYFSCTQCQSSLRIPKKTGHIKVTCPRCNYSFIKKTWRGHVDKMKKKMAR